MLAVIFAILTRRNIFYVGHTHICLTSLQTPGCTLHSTLGLKQDSCMVFEIEASMPCPPTEDKNELQGLRRIKTMKVPNLPVLTLRLLLLKFFTVVMQRHLKGTQIYMKLIKLHQQKYPAEMKV